MPANPEQARAPGCARHLQRGPVCKEASQRPLGEAIIRALPRSSRAIGAAAVTLAVSFGLLIVIALQPFRDLALAMCLSILLDAVVLLSVPMPPRPPWSARPADGAGTTCDVVRAHSRRPVRGNIL